MIKFRKANALFALLLGLALLYMTFENRKTLSSKQGTDLTR